LPIASPAPKTIRAANAIAVAVPALRRRVTGPAAWAGGGAGVGDGTGGTDGTDALGGSMSACGESTSACGESTSACGESTSACGGNGTSGSSSSARSLRSGETSTSSGLSGRSSSWSTIGRCSFGRAEIPTVNSTSVRRKRPPPCSHQQSEVGQGQGSNQRPSASEHPSPAWINGLRVARLPAGIPAGDRAQVILIRRIGHLDNLAGRRATSVNPLIILARPSQRSPPPEGSMFKKWRNAPITGSPR